MRLASASQSEMSQTLALPYVARVGREMSGRRGMRTSAKVSTATSCLPASAEAFAALYRLSAETSVPSVSDEASVTRGWRGERRQSRPRKATIRFGDGNQSRSIASRNGTRRLRASSRFATLDRREHRPPHVPVTPASRSASLSRSSPARRASSHASNHAGRVSLCRCAKTLAFDFTPATSAGPGTRGSSPLGMTFGETAFISSARRTRHSNVTRGERGGRSRGPGGRAARCAFIAGFEYRTRTTQGVMMPRQKAKAQKSRKLGRRTRAVDLVPRA